VELQRKSFDQPDQRSEFPDVRVDVVTIGNRTVARMVAEPGWRWSRSIGPAAGTERCEKEHFAYIVSGRAVNEWEDGRRIEFGPGDLVQVPPGHEAWVVGDEPLVFLDLQPLL
jgi:mannose-6-phosphate isomerase-like protein (cupin superfamily)